MTIPVAPSIEERVILVDASDRETGSEEKLRAHQRGVLHRAFSVFLFDDHGRVLLQQRSMAKYHSAGRWSNACCGHPRPNESNAGAASRRLAEEMGIDSPLREQFAFAYRAELSGGLTEHEYDHVFVGRFTGTPSPDPREVMSWGWMPMTQLVANCSAKPSSYTAWLPIALAELQTRRLAP